MILHKAFLPKNIDEILMVAAVILVLFCLMLLVSIYLENAIAIAELEKILLIK